ncbi:PREDICTED: cuticlin-1-like [Priapulus caudatus]|uniref:Cuticlin-1-like n=1 Tax=Priapulus caudatus TaxID=37621 RepID=A0ABM1ELI4_PRICU|nr:PREDICTED: cuticlin-1-like [Priapulus caudatus]
MLRYTLVVLLLAVGAWCQDLVEKPQVVCNADDITVTAEFREPFVGRVYPKGLSKFSNCSLNGSGDRSVSFTVSLFGCATIRNQESDANNNLEYHNVIVFQRHPMLVTGQDLAYRVHCNYALGEKTVSSDVTVEMVQTTLLPSAAPEMPSCELIILMGGPDGRLVDGAVSLGTELTFMITMGPSEVYGSVISNCIARDGMGMGEQMLIDADGCAVDEQIFGNLIYDPANKRTYSPFNAHKFPTSGQVYYQCDVRLCIIGRCEIPECATVLGPRRRKRQAIGQEETEEEPRLIVRDVVIIMDFDDEQVGSAGNNELPLARLPIKTASVPAAEQMENKICMNTVAFALAIALFAGIFLLSLVISAFLCARTRSRKGSELSSTFDNPSYQ